MVLAASKAEAAATSKVDNKTVAPDIETNADG